MIYLASPYSHPNAEVREKRYRQVLEQLAIFTNEGHVIFSPIVHSYPMEIYHSLPGDWEFWQKFDRDFISCSEALWVLQLDGWEHSKGIKAEMAIARELDKPITYLPWSPKL